MRLISFLLLLLVLMGAYWLYKQPETKKDIDDLKVSAEKMEDKAIDAAAKISNKIEDQKIPGKTERAIDKTGEVLENAKESVQEKTDALRDDFHDAKERDRDAQAR